MTRSSNNIGFNKNNIIFCVDSPFYLFIFPLRLRCACARDINDVGLEISGAGHTTYKLKHMCVNAME